MYIAAPFACQTRHKSFMTTNNAYNNNTNHKLSRVVRKPDFCICENKDADQLRGNRTADQHLCFRHMDSAIPLLSKSEAI